MTDFTNCPIVPGRAYNGANGSKIAVEYGGGIYMLKFPPSGERKPTNLSYTNSCISEHLASSIFNLIGINAQKTELGTFSIKGKTKVVCACKDFATGSKRLFDFCSIKNTILDSDSNGSGTELEDVMDTIDKQQYVSPVELREHFWNVFIVDALLGNFDRHNQQTRRRLTLDLKPGSGSSNLQTSAKIQRIKICTRPLRRLRPRR